MPELSQRNDDASAHAWGVKPFRDNRTLQAALIAFALFWLWMGYDPYRIFNWWLENLLTLLAAAGLVATRRWFAWSNASYLLILAFIALHTVGAHYSYNETPLDRWLDALFDFERNHFDRVVHFAFGLLTAYPAYEFLRRVAGVRHGWACAIVPCVVLAFGAFYELIEMWVTSVLDPERGALFLGSQGDPWDAHHDMEVALYGAIIAMLATAWIKGKKHH
ncbi:DUF2238 domain-containing protein [Paenibacillus methanolicus]|uniref:Putative membrane protein n=1 Tax=Paenibacillus methanolicus TaxID=582686 RepID=A0A5S5BU36_9BACL|nr:DUF2238 domain-containing protein [Paenibacillus methanolicus]TYP70685.1 putative membrane protein [Paenibacillus methanolicus]